MLLMFLPGVVAACCGYAVIRLFRHSRVLQLWEGLEAVSFKLQVPGSAKEFPVLDWPPLQELMAASEDAERVAALVQLRHEVDGALASTRLVIRQAWKICLFSSVSAFFAVWSQAAWVAWCCLIIGVCAASWCAAMGHRLGRRSTTAGRRWNMLIRRIAQTLNR